MSPLMLIIMHKTRILIKIAVFTIIYALIFYLLPLPSPAFLGFLFPLAYLYVDMTATKHMQTQFLLGFGLGSLFGIAVVKVTLLSVYFGFITMSACVFVLFYASCFDTWMKVPLFIMAVLSAMLFNFAIGPHLLMSSGLFEKFMLGIIISMVLYGVIDLLLGDPQHEIIPSKITVPSLKQLFSCDWLSLRHTLCLYLVILCVIAIEKFTGISSVICALATGSAFVVLASDHSVTKKNIRLRAGGAIAGIVIGVLQLKLLTVIPFFFIHVGLIVLLQVYGASIILRYASAPKCVPQAVVTYLMIVVLGTHINLNIDSALLRLGGILLGVFLAYVVTIFFFALPAKGAATNIKGMQFD